MMDFLRHMAIFARVVECGSISATALELNLSKSVVSQHLKALEKELGVVLLHRTTRRQVLTPAGHDFYAACSEISQIADRAWNVARETQHLPMGSVTINAPHALMGEIIVPAIGALTSQYEKIRPILVSEDQRVDLIEAKVDVAVRVGKTTGTSYRQICLGEFRDVLCASPVYLMRHQSVLAALTDHPEYCLDCDYIANQWQGTHITHRLWHNPTGAIVEFSFIANRLVNSLPMVISMAELGAGLAFIPDFIFRSYQGQGKLEKVLPGYESASVSVYALHAFGRQPPVVVQMCIDAIQQRMAKLNTAASV